MTTWHQEQRIKRELEAAKAAGVPYNPYAHETDWTVVYCPPRGQMMYVERVTDKAHADLLAKVSNFAGKYAYVVAPKAVMA